MAAPQKHKVPYEKLIIGPVMVFAEMTTGGNWMESLKVTRQATNMGYAQIARLWWKQEGVLSFYRGFFPWGLLQTLKGVPVLFASSEASYHAKRYGLGSVTADSIGGVLGGVSQGVFLTPTQRLRTIAMTKPDYQPPKNVGQMVVLTSRLFGEVVRSEGIGSLFRGLTPMCLRRGLDWGLRFNGNAWAKRFLQGDDPNKKLSTLETIAAGFFGGAVSTVTMPLDNMLANAQKAGAQSAGLFSLASKIYAEHGIAGFTRGWLMRIAHSGYHTVWMASIGSMVFDWWRSRGSN